MLDRAIQATIGLVLIALAMFVIPSVMLAAIMIIAGYILMTGKFPSRSSSTEEEE